jgi:predicted trehalose synthase
LWLNLFVAKAKKKKRKFTATTAVKSMARTALGSPPPVQREESLKRVQKEKHKPTLGQMLSDRE